MEHPERRIADLFMANKGYPDLRPAKVERIAGEYTWVFHYRLPDGRLELEVCWTEHDGWDAYVAVFEPSR